MDPSEWVRFVTTLAVVGEVLAALVVKLASATSDEIPALCDEAEILAQCVVECCADTAPVDPLHSEEVTELRANLHEWAEALQALIADVADLCWARAWLPLKRGIERPLRVPIERRALRRARSAVVGASAGSGRPDGRNVPPGARAPAK
jgi:hypothetical protein